MIFEKLSLNVFSTAKYPAIQSIFPSVTNTSYILDSYQEKQHQCLPFFLNSVFFQSWVKNLTPYHCCWRDMHYERKVSHPRTQWPGPLNVGCILVNHFVTIHLTMGLNIGLINCQRHPMSIIFDGDGCIQLWITCISLCPGSSSPNQQKLELI